MSTFRTLLAAAAIATVPFASQAITVVTSMGLEETSVNNATSQPFVFAGFTESGDIGGSYSYDFVNDFGSAISFGTTAFAGPNIVDGVTLTFSDGTVIDVASNSEGSAAPIFQDGEEFSILFEYGATRAANPPLGRFGFTANIAEVAAVPLPAGALLLTTALGGMALSRRRKSKADKA